MFTFIPEIFEPDLRKCLNILVTLLTYMSINPYDLDDHLLQ